jgi:hypothetical protein
MNPLDKAIARLNELEPGMRSLDTLFVLGEIRTKNEGGFQAGDFDMHIWGHSLDGFSVGAIVRVRQDGKPFPQLVQSQKKWVLCCKGTIKVVRADEETTLTEGSRLTIPPKIAHEIYPVSKECSAIIVIVPADPGMQ